MFLEDFCFVIFPFSACLICPDFASFSDSFADKNTFNPASFSYALCFLPNTGGIGHRLLRNILLPFFGFQKKEGTLFCSLFQNSRWMILLCFIFWRSAEDAAARTGLPKPHSRFLHTAVDCSIHRFLVWWCWME